MIYRTGSGQPGTFYHSLLKVTLLFPACSFFTISVVLMCVYLLSSDAVTHLASEGTLLIIAAARTVIASLPWSSSFAMLSCSNSVGPIPC